MDTYELPRLNQGDIKILNKPISTNDIEDVIKNLPTKVNPVPEGFTDEVYKTTRNLEMTKCYCFLNSLIKLKENKYSQIHA